MSRIDLSWGESVAVRKEFIECSYVKRIEYLSHNLNSMNYSPFEGDELLLEHTREVIKIQLNRTYRHVVLTNGAAGGCVIAMRAYKMQGREIAVTYQAPYFSLYPSMVKAAGLYHETQCYADPAKSVFLVDSPSNPEGIVRTANRTGMPIIYDAVYGNKVYSIMNQVIPHDVLVGSYSKLTGLNGIRIGWIATDDDLLYERIKELVAAEYCGLSVPSMNILNNILPHYDWSRFHERANNSLDDNRTQWQKLEKFFGDAKVSENGMFFWGPMDNKAKELFTKAGIIWTSSKKLGTFGDTHGRFNIGQSNELIKEAVKTVLKTDRIK